LKDGKGLLSNGIRIIRLNKEIDFHELASKEPFLKQPAFAKAFGGFMR
jgi:hypothetical protein